MAERRTFLAQQEILVPLARNEWICWIESAKKAETRSCRIEWGCSSLRMENDAPVVGPDAPTADAKMVKRDIASADWSRPTSSLRLTPLEQSNTAIRSLKDGRSDGQEPPGLGERGRATLPHKTPASARQQQRLVRPQRAH